MKKAVKQITTRWLPLLLAGLSLLGLFTLSSCLKEEPLWQLPPPGEETVDEIAMGESYANTVYFKFSTGAKYERNINTWQLAFESAADGFRVRVNGGRVVQLYNTGSKNFEQVWDVGTITNWQWDAASGHPDSTAAGNWPADSINGNSASNVYLVDMGLNSPVKCRKFQILNVSPTAYTIQHANPDNTDGQEAVILKSTLSAYTYFDLLSNAVVQYEPPNTDYDIVFTRYRHIFLENGEIIPYLVNGALLNPVQTQAAKLTGSVFETLTYDSVSNLALHNHADAIGYEWKSFNLETNKYTVHPNLYVVKDAAGALWKLEFIGFYNSAGLKGYPKFRYQRL